jgi:hypothetical protein
MSCGLASNKPHEYNSTEIKIMSTGTYATIELNTNTITIAESRNPDAVRIGPNTMVIFDPCACIQKMYIVRSLLTVGECGFMLYFSSFISFKIMIQLPLNYIAAVRFLDSTISISGVHFCSVGSPTVLRFVSIIE